MTTPTPRLPAEWEHQDAVLLAWVQNKAGWSAIYSDAEPAYAHLVSTVLRHQAVILCVESDAKGQQVRTLLQALGADLSALTLVTLPSNDSWARDFGPIGVQRGGKMTLLDFKFNSWGFKYPYELDNTVSQRLASLGLIRRPASVDIYLEGGSIDSNGSGSLLTTSECLLHPSRNPQLSRADYEALFAREFGVQHTLWIDHGWLAGDDTDGHIDMLVRFCAADTLAYLHCDKADDPHFPHLDALRQQVERLRQANGEPFKLIALPFPQACYNAAGGRLPASYANFLILNKAVLVPVYDVPQDALALQILAAQFPDRLIEPVPARWFIHQGGSVHCLTMQLFSGSLGAELDA